MILTKYVLATGALFTSLVSGRPSGLEAREQINTIPPCPNTVPANTLPALLSHILTHAMKGCRYADGGNVKFEAHDDAINYGDALPKDVFTKLKDVCTRTGCSGGNKAEFKTNVAGHYSEGKKYSIVAEGSFSGKGLGTRDNMVEILSKLAGATTEAREAKVNDPNDVFQDKKVAIAQHYSSKQFNIRYEVEGGSGALVSFLNVYIEKEKEENKFCVFLMKTLGATTGILSGVAGGGFSLAEILCEVAK